MANDEQPAEPSLNHNTYVVALLNHAQCMDKDVIARVACDNGADPIWWCEAANPDGSWTLAV